jgi:hypothetical protein
MVFVYLLQRIFPVSFCFLLVALHVDVYGQSDLRSKQLSNSSDNCRHRFFAVHLISYFVTSQRWRWHVRADNVFVE